MVDDRPCSERGTIESTKHYNLFQTSQIQGPGYDSIEIPIKAPCSYLVGVRENVTLKEYAIAKEKSEALLLSSIFWNADFSWNGKIHILVFPGNFRRQKLPL